MRKGHGANMRRRVNRAVPRDMRSPCAESSRGPNAGFALVITVVLLTMLVLALYALSALGRIGADISATAVYQTQARRNALLALHNAMGELQRYAGPDGAITGMAGLAGVAAGAGNPARHWCGIWDSDGQFLRWLASGSSGASIPNLSGPDALAMMASGALGADGTDKEHVRVLTIPIHINNPEGEPVRHGTYAWWVGDEGVKLSAVVTDAEAPVPGGKHAIDELLPVLSPEASNLNRVEAYAQLAHVPAVPLTLGQLQANLHALSRAHQGLVGTSLQLGRLNVNSTSARYWRGVGATYNRLRPSDPIGVSLTTFANRMRDNFESAVSPGKNPGGPFLSVDAFLDSPLIEAGLQGSDVTPLEFREAMLVWLSVRSDTFRIRAYGDAINPADSTKVEASAWCEAIVQRTAADIPGFGRRFVIMYFRWLGPDDI